MTARTNNGKGKSNGDGKSNGKGKSNGNGKGKSISKYGDSSLRSE